MESWIGGFGRRRLMRMLEWRTRRVGGGLLIDELGCGVGDMVCLDLQLIGMAADIVVGNWLMEKVL